MPRVAASTRLPVSVDEAWQQIGSFRSVGDWHPMLAGVDSDGDLPGARRVATTVDGQRQVERLLEFDPGRHVYRYTMESTPMPVTDYVGEFRLSAAEDGASTVSWVSEFEVTSAGKDETAQAIRQFLTAVWTASIGGTAEATPTVRERSWLPSAGSRCGRGRWERVHEGDATRGGTMATSGLLSSGPPRTYVVVCDTGDPVAERR